MKQIIFIGLNHAQVPYLKALKDLNFYVIGIDKNPSAPGIELVDVFIKRGYDEYKKIEEDLSGDKHINPYGVFTAAAQFSHVIAARISKYYDIKYPSERLINTILDKSKFYKLFAENGLPIPETKYVYTSQEMEQHLKTYPSEERFYVKSDFSKNPKYVYSGSCEELINSHMNWNVDTHFRSCYVLQPEILGTALRINILGKDHEVYDFDSGNELEQLNENTILIVKELKNFSKKIGLENWIVKFDVIDGSDSFVTLDIGIDPPSRMVNKYQRKGLNFAEFYVNKYLNAFK